MNKHNYRYNSLHALRLFRKKIKRNKLKHKRNLGWIKFINDTNKNYIEKNGIKEKSKNKYSLHKRNFYSRPKYSATIKHIAFKKEAFSNTKIPRNINGTLIVPNIFSLTENYEESYLFLKTLFHILYFQSCENIYLDYSQCNRIDLDASVCMDILLGEFLIHYKECERCGYTVNVNQIEPINFEREEIKKVLFSIGAFSSIKGFRVEYPDIIPFRLRFGVIKNPDASKMRERHITQLVDYVIECMKKMNRTLTADAESNLFQVIGEVLINAQEHSSGDKSFSIGYFQDSEKDGEHIGIFNLVILNFGKSIYEIFKDPNCENKEIVEKMTELSDNYTKRGFFTKAEFEEQTLWTLYALQEGVTCKVDWKRGNGSIRFIDSFFKLKGNNEKDDVSYLSIFSGNTRITFDGTHRLIDKFKGKEKKPFKMMTFNQNGDIEDKPDKKYVTFAENYFPGTLISAKIQIKDINSEQV